MKPIVTWILIADGARARVVEHTGPGKGLTEVPGLKFSDERMRAGEIMADRPGRSFSSAGHGRSAMEQQTDPVDKREADFVAGVAEIIAENNTAKKFDRLIIAAAPQALGDLRKAMTPQIQETIIAEIPKDLTRIPNNELGKHFEQVLAV